LPLQGHIRNRGNDRTFDLIIADEGAFRAVARHDPKMIPGAASCPGKEKFTPEREDLFR